MLVQTDQILLDKRFQVRVSGLNTDTVDEYCDAMKAGESFPPLEVFNVDGKLYLVDGWHRLQAMRVLKIAETEAQVTEGTWDEALRFVWFSANRKNGQRLTRADKQALCETLLTDPEYKNLPDLQLCQLIGVSRPAIVNARKRLGLEKSDEVVGADGRVWKRKKGVVLNEEPPQIEAPWATEAEANGDLEVKVSERLVEHLEALNATLAVIERTNIVLMNDARSSIEATLKRIRKHAKVVQRGG